MTDEERKELLAELRGSPSRYTKMAADEIVRLEEMLDTMIDLANQKLLRAQMLNHNLNEEIEHLKKENERLAKEVARLEDENGVIREQCQNMLDMTVG